MSTLPSRARTIKTRACLRALLAIAVVVAAAVCLQVQPLAATSGTCMLPTSQSTSQSLHSLDAKESRLDADPDADSKVSPMAQLRVLEQRCASLKKDFERVQGLDAESIHTSAGLFHELRTFDSQYMDAMGRFDLSIRSQQSPENISDNNVSKIVSRSRLGTSRRALVRSCFLQLVTKARQHAAALPYQEGNSNGAFGCEVGVLSSIERHAVSEAEAEDEHAGVLSSLGAYWSELAISGRSAAPLVGFGYDSSGKVLTKWMMNSWDSLPSAEMVQSEMLLSKSLDVSDVKLPNLHFVQAQRLIAHADILEAKAYHSAAVQRYRKAAEIARKNGNAPLSAQAFSKLSFSLKQYGSTTEALEAAGKAIELTQDPLARFVKASIQVSSGLLQTREDLKMAEDQLKSLTGQMPTPELEAQRHKMRVEMMLWSWVSQGDITKCTGIKDPARFLICVICKMIY